MSKMLMGCACAGTVLGGMYLHGDLSGGQIYNVGLHDAYLRAQNLQPDASSMNVAANFAPDKELYSDDAVKWHYKLDGQDVGKLAATLRSASGGRTRVWVSFEEGDGEATPAVKRLRTELKQLGTVVMSEQVGAAIEQRPVDKGIIQAASAAYLTAHAGDVFQGVSEKMNEAAADFHKQDADDAYRHAQSAAGRPTVDLDHKDRRYR
jgi:hypothetical protein